MMDRPSGRVVGRRIRHASCFALLATLLASLSATAVADAIPPDAPERPTLAAGSLGLAVNLSWTAVNGPLALLPLSVTAIGYDVYRDDQPDVVLSPTTYLATTSVPQYLDLEETAGRQLYYRVVARNSAGETSPPSEVASIDVTGALLGAHRTVESWLEQQQEAAQGFRIRFNSDYPSSYTGRVGGTIEDFAELDGERVDLAHIAFAEAYSDEYVGPVHGTWSNVPDPANYEIRVYSRSDALYLQGTYALGSDGTWTSGDEIARTGEKIARLVRRSDGGVIASTGDSPTTIRGLAVRVYSRTDVDYLQEEVSVGADGTWRTRDGVAAGEKIARLVNVATGRVYNSTEWSGSLAYKGLVRSFWIPQSDPDYGYVGDATHRSGYRLEQRSFLYDDALAILAYLQDGNATRARDVLTQLAQLQAGDGSFVFSYDTFLGRFADEYRRTGAMAWLGYAAVQYEIATGDRQFRNLATRLADHLTSLQVTADRGYAADDPRYGSILGGHGSYDSDYVFHDTAIPWVSTEHNIDAYFFLRDLAYVSHDDRYAGAADLVKGSLLTNHWDGAHQRFFQGVSLDGPDSGQALDLYSWGGLFLLAVGQEAKARALADQMQAFEVTVPGVQTSTDPESYNVTYATDQPITGYRPYLESPGYPDPPSVVWGEGSWGAALLRLRLGEDVSDPLSALRRLQRLDRHGGVVQVTAGRRSLPYEFHVWPATAATAWESLVLSNPAALWRPDNWNVGAHSADVSGKTVAVINGADDPETFSWTPELPPGWTARVTADGDVEAVDDAGTSHGVFATQWAEDDDDQRVPVQYSTSGNTVFMTVPHRGSGYAYPIVADSAVDRFDGAKVALVCSLLPGFVPHRTDYRQLNRYEKRFCRWHPRLCLKFSKDKGKADRMHPYLFTEPLRASDGTKANAFRHAFWVAEMVVSTGSDADDNHLALDFAFAHEGYAFESDDDEKRLKSRMDLHNNGVGYRYADANPGHNDEFMCNGAMQKALEGSLSSDEELWSLHPATAYWIYATHETTKQSVEVKTDWDCSSA